MDISAFRPPAAQETFSLQDIPTHCTAEIESKKEAVKLLEQNIERMTDLQGKLYAQGKYAILIIFQAMDTAGKDGAIRHVMKGLNPQATSVQSFKQPSAEELRHDYLWRASKCLPERGQFGIFNRSYYEEVLVVRVHDLIKKQSLPEKHITPGIWTDRFRQIRDFERYLSENGLVILKFFLHISKEEQKQRLLKRIDNPSKNWKFSEADITERQYWEQYQQCYQEAIAATDTSRAPWYIIPSDKKWFARLAISEVIVQNLEPLGLGYPVLAPSHLSILQECKQKLLGE
jgi:PPK2 family polyphosphate:nucleotide phosphotransferase